MRVSTRVVLLLSAAVFAGAVSAAVLDAQRPTALAGSGGQAAAPTIDPAREQQLFQQFCYSCHSERARTAGLDSAKKLALDSLDTSNVRRDAKAWELVARKLRAGMMPPAEMRRPDPATYEAMGAWLEGELDRDAAPYTPPPAPSPQQDRVRELDSRPARPADRSGEISAVGRLDLRLRQHRGRASALVHARRGLRDRGAEDQQAGGWRAEDPTLVVYRAREDTSQDYQVEGLPFGTRGGLLVEHLFPSDGEYTITVTPIFGDNMTPIGFGSVPCEQIEFLLDFERLALVDWNGGGRAPATECRGRLQTAARTGQDGPEAFFGKGAPMRMRTHVAAGSHMVASRSSRRSTRRCWISTGISVDRPSRPDRPPATRSSRTSARFASRGRSARRTPPVPPAAARCSSARPRGRARKRPARGASCRTSRPAPSGGRSRRRTSIR